MTALADVAQACGTADLAAEPSTAKHRSMWAGGGVMVTHDARSGAVAVFTTGDDARRVADLYEASSELLLAVIAEARSVAASPPGAETHG